MLSMVLTLQWSLFAMVGTGHPLTCTSQDADSPSSEWHGTVQDPWQRPRHWLLLVGNESLLQAAVLQQITEQMQGMDLHRYREVARLVLPHLAVLTALLESPSWLLLASLQSQNNWSLSDLSGCEQQVADIKSFKVSGALRSGTVTSCSMNNKH